MSQNNLLRVLFCMGINQNFFDASAAEAKQVWGAFGVMMKGMAEMPGIRVIGNMDDDRLMVGPSTTSPWTTYVLADADTIESVVAVCNLLRTTPVGDSGSKLWKYCKIEARVGRELIIQD
ncbi:IacB protein [Shimwellia pseudoproteus]|uniref:IacB protein n=1 Tax=Shimwellia pseudoproteus TaxID=570012 RepID=UPI0018ED6535|nr:IacB protein [Shimwellia pseudoproteus]MBJ3816619.1 IacB protein [Shimwellia pseudoproteus]